MHCSRATTIWRLALSRRSAVRGLQCPTTWLLQASTTSRLHDTLALRPFESESLNLANVRLYGCSPQSGEAIAQRTNFMRPSSLSARRPTGIQAPDGDRPPRIALGNIDAGWKRDVPAGLKSSANDRSFASRL